MSARENGQQFAVLPSQVRAARAMLEWTLAQLADKAGVPMRTLHRFEHSQTQPQRRTAAALRQALELAGVQFIDPDGAGGSGVRFARPPDP